MDNNSDAHGRHKCAACFRQFNRAEHLVEHMRTARHSSHDPRCAVCGKHCRSFEALRDHLGAGGSSLPKAAHCAAVFAARGCALCLRVFATAARLGEHHATCRLARASPPISMSRLQISGQGGGGGGGGGGALALGCKMVGAGSDGSLDVCARVCLVDEREEIVFETFVKPLVPVTHYRHERPELLRGGVTVKQAKERVQELLLDGEQPWKVRSNRGRAMILVGHGLDHDLAALGMDYPAYLRRDTATYPPLMKTSGLSNSLRFLTRTYLGYDIQTTGGGQQQHPFEDCVAAMRLYRRMLAQPHRKDGDGGAVSVGADNNAFPAWRQRELERMAPEELLQLSTPDYYCWCLDTVNSQADS